MSWFWLYERTRDYGILYKQIEDLENRNKDVNDKYIKLKNNLELTNSEDKRFTTEMDIAALEERVSKLKF